MRPQIVPYRQLWIYAITLIIGVDPPTEELDGECAEAAFALAHYFENPGEPAQQRPGLPQQLQGEEGDSDGDESLTSRGTRSRHHSRPYWRNCGDVQQRGGRG